MTDQSEPLSETVVRRGPGRPRQPNCPDCIKAGRPNVPKARGKGYCDDHHYRRYQAYRKVDQDEISMEDATLKVLHDEIDVLRAQVLQKDRALSSVSSLFEEYKETYQPASDLTERIEALERELRNEQRRRRTYQMVAHEAKPQEVPHPDDPDQSMPAMRIGS